MEYLFSIIILIILVFVIIDLKIGVSLYLVYTILVPFDLLLFSMNSSTFLQFGLLFSLFICSDRYFNKSSLKNNLKPFSPLLLLFIVLFCFTPFQQYVPFGIEFTYFQYEIRQFFILPFVIWCVTKYDPKAVRAVNIAIIIASIVVFVYEFYLLANNGINYYLMYLSTFSGQEVKEVMLGYDDSRFMVRACSTFSHSMNYALFLILDYVFILSIKDKINKVLWVALLVCCIVCIFTSNVRSSIVAFIVASSFYVLLMRNWKVALSFAFGAGVLLNVVSQIPEFRELIESLYKQSAYVEGSSLNVRIKQLEGCFVEISDCALFGKGYDWTTFYISKYHSHPVMLAFESVILKYLCNWGWVGLILYVIAYYRFAYYSYRIMNNRDEKVQALSLIVIFLIYCMATGDYNYTQYFLPFYAIFIANHHKNQYKLPCKIQKS